MRDGTELGYTLSGFRKIHTGTYPKDDDVDFLPNGKPASISGIKSTNTDADWFCGDSEDVDPDDDIPDNAQYEFFDYAEFIAGEALPNFIEDADPPTDEDDLNAKTTLPYKRDTDGDFVPDGTFYIPFAGAAKRYKGEDRDNDGKNDETFNTSYPPDLNISETDPRNKESVPTDCLEDTDGDGLADEIELYLGCDPYDMDSDNDGLKDGDEYHGTGRNKIFDFSYKTDPLNWDTDGDGLSDGLELGVTSYTILEDGLNQVIFGRSESHTPINYPEEGDKYGYKPQDGEGYRIYDANPDLTVHTDPTELDTNHDGISDGESDSNGNGDFDGENEKDPVKGFCNVAGCDKIIYENIVTLPVSRYGYSEFDFNLKKKISFRKGFDLNSNKLTLYTLPSNTISYEIIKDEMQNCGYVIIEMKSICFDETNLKIYLDLSLEKGNKEETSQNSIDGDISDDAWGIYFSPKKINPLAHKFYKNIKFKFISSTTTMRINDILYDDTIQQCFIRSGKIWQLQPALIAAICLNETRHMNRAYGFAIIDDMGGNTHGYGQLLYENAFALLAERAGLNGHKEFEHSYFRKNWLESSFDDSSTYSPNFGDNLMNIAGIPGYLIKDEYLYEPPFSKQYTKVNHGCAKYINQRIALYHIDLVSQFIRRLSSCYEVRQLNSQYVNTQLFNKSGKYWEYDRNCNASDGNGQTAFES